MKKIWRCCCVNAASPMNSALARARTAAGNGSAGEFSCVCRLPISEAYLVGEQRAEGELDETVLREGAVGGPQRGQSVQGGAEAAHVVVVGEHPLDPRAQFLLVRVALAGGDADPNPGGAYSRPLPSSESKKRSISSRRSANGSDVGAA